MCFLWIIGHNSSNHEAQERSNTAGKRSLVKRGLWNLTLIYVFSWDVVLNLFFDGVTGIFAWQQRTVRAKQRRCFCPFERPVRSRLANGHTQGTERRTSVSSKQALKGLSLRGVIPGFCIQKLL